MRVPSSGASSWAAAAPASHRPAASETAARRLPEPGNLRTRPGTEPVRVTRKAPLRAGIMRPPELPGEIAGQQARRSAARHWHVLPSQRSVCPFPRKYARHSVGSIEPGAAAGCLRALFARDFASRMLFPLIAFLSGAARCRAMPSVAARDRKVQRAVTKGPGLSFNALPSVPWADKVGRPRRPSSVSRPRRKTGEPFWFGSRLNRQEPDGCHDRRRAGPAERQGTRRPRRHGRSRRRPAPVHASPRPGLPVRGAPDRIGIDGGRHCKRSLSGVVAAGARLRRALGGLDLAARHRPFQGAVDAAKAQGGSGSTTKTPPPCPTTRTRRKWR